MKTAERDDLLVRIDEQLKSLNREITDNVRPDVHAIEEHAREQNDKVSKAMEKCASNETRGRTNTRLVIFAISLTTGLGIYALSRFVS